MSQENAEIMQRMLEFQDTAARLGFPPDPRQLTQSQRARVAIEIQRSHCEQ